MDEAERLGLKMGLFNGAGWSATVAAFVTPELAMQEAAWTKAQVSGPGELKVTLEVPKAALGLERDMQKDPVVNWRYYVESQKVEGHFKDLAVFAVPALPEGVKPWKLKDAWNKAGFGKTAKPFHPDGRTAPADQVVPLEGIIDLSERMNEGGELEWEAPAGRWTILRMGYQPTARQNHPAAWGGSGLEIDKMSAQAMDFYWENFLDRVVETAGKRVGGAFDRVTIDSFEAGHQNWTRGFEKVFEKSKGYDLKVLLPESPWMSMEVLGEIEALLKNGAVVCGPKPMSPPGRVSDEERKVFALRIDRIWGACDGKRVTRNPHGRGVVYWGRPLGAVLGEQRVAPDFSFTHQTGEPDQETLYPACDIEFLHRADGGDDIYFLSKQQAEGRSPIRLR